MIYRKEEIAERLKQERKDHGYTLDRLAKKLNYSRPTIIDWERKDGQNRIPNNDQLIALCNLYDCHISYLLCEIDTPKRDDAPANEATGLDNKAIDVLKEAKMDAIDAIDEIIALGHVNYQPLERKAAIKDRMHLQNFLSSILTFKRDNEKRKILDITDRLSLIIHHKQSLNTMPALMKRLCIEAYSAAARHSGLYVEDTFPGNRHTLYMDYIKYAVKDNRKELLKEFCNHKAYAEYAKRIKSDITDDNAANDILINRIETKMWDAYSSIEKTQPDNEEAFLYFVTQDIMSLVTNYIDEASSEK